MGDISEYQPLTERDKITVVIYRIGIALSALIISVLAIGFASNIMINNIDALFNGLLFALYFSVGLSVVFIHLYVSSFHRFLKLLYAASLLAGAALLSVTGKSIFMSFYMKPYLIASLLPLAGCLGFITAKEAFCFRLTEGYVLAMLMPLYLLLLSSGRVSAGGLKFGLIVTAVLLVVFTLRKVFMPLHFDIGDKSAYK